MTVKLLTNWGNQPIGTLYTSDSATETAMIAAGVATATLTGAVPWIPSLGTTDPTHPVQVGLKTAAEIIAINALIAAGKVSYPEGSWLSLSSTGADNGTRYALKGVGTAATFSASVEGGGSSVAVSDEGAALTSAATSLNFTGAGVTATAVGGAVTVDIPAGTGSSGPAAITGVTPVSLTTSVAASIATFVTFADVQCDAVEVENLGRFDLECQRNGTGPATRHPRGAKRLYPVAASSNELGFRRADYATATGDAATTAVVGRAISGGRKFASEVAVSATIMGQSVAYVAFPSQVCTHVELANGINEGLAYKVNGGSITQLEPGVSHLVPVDNTNKISISRAQTTSSSGSGYSTTLVVGALTLASGKTLSELTPLTTFSLARMIAPNAYSAFPQLRGATTKGKTLPYGVAVGEPYVPHRKPKLKRAALFDLAANMTVSGGDAVADGAPFLDAFVGTTMPRVTLTGADRLFAQTALPGALMPLADGSVHVALAFPASTGLTQFRLEVFSSGSPTSPPANYTTTNPADDAVLAGELMNRALQGLGHVLTFAIAGAKLTTQVGSGADLANPTWFRIRLGGTATIGFGAIDPVPNLLSQGVVCIAFDDNIPVQYNTYAPYMIRRNQRGMLMGSPLVGVGDSSILPDQYRTLLDLHQWQWAAQDFNSEKIAQGDAVDWQNDAAQIRLLIKQFGGRGYLDASGYTNSSLTNLQQSGARQLIKAMYRTWSTAVGGNGTALPDPIGECFPFADPWSVRRQNIVGVTDAQNKAIIDQARAIKGVAYFFQHGEETTRLFSILDYCWTNNIPVITLDDLALINQSAPLF